MDIVERLRARKKTREFDSWGMYVDISNAPSELEIEAADLITRLRSLTAEMEKAMELDALVRIANTLDEIADGVERTNKIRADQIRHEASRLMWHVTTARSALSRSQGTSK